MHNFYHNTKLLRVISPDEGAGDNVAKVGVVVDMAGWRDLEFLIATGTIADADVTFAVLVEDSDDNVTFAAVADAGLLGTEALAGFQFDDDDEIRKIDYIGGKRYVRLTITPSGNTGAWDICAMAIQGGGRHNPSQDGAGAAVTQTP